MQSLKEMAHFFQACALLALLLFVPQPCWSVEPSSHFLKPSSKTTWHNRVRSHGLQNVDDFLSWTIPPYLKVYALAYPLQATSLRTEFSQNRDFLEWHGYFSPYDPLVGKISKSREDIQVTRCLLVKISQEIPSLNASSFATDETLAKVLAYRDMKKGDQILIPLSRQDRRLATYRVDHIFNLWRGMPAFGLISDSGGEPILLFRGTDFSLDSERGWASLMSDVDSAGPGLTVFRKSQEEIHAWLMKVAQRGLKARVIGFSLGGVLAGYTYLYENAWINSEGCVAFNPPGISDAIFQEWNQLSDAAKRGFRVYVNRGDVISKVGKLFGDVYELSVDQPLKPLKAHTLFVSAESQAFQAKVDVEQENLTRRL
jgi:hypothetical protein